MASAGRISSDTGQAARGLRLVRPFLGQTLENIHRWVVGSIPEPFGHGITQLRFPSGVLVVAPGANEDYLELSLAPPPEVTDDESLWAPFDIENLGKWSRFIGQPLRHVDCFSDGYEDVALVFYFGEGEHFATVLANTDALLSEGLAPFQDELEEVVPRFRERIKPRPVRSL